MQPRMPERKPSKLELLKQKEIEVARQIKEEKKRQGQERRKWETNQKVRVGAAIISEAQKNPEKMAELLKLLDRFFTKGYDRKFFAEWGLPPQQEKPTIQTENPPAASQEP